MNLRNLYQEVILDHNKKPRNFGPLEEANRRAHGDNPLCGDKYDVELVVDDGVISEVHFHGSGCAISKAAASMMTQHVKGMSEEEARGLVEEFRGMLTGKLDPEGNENLRHLKVFEGVSQRPERVKCAVLPWHTLLAALKGEEAISTEGDNDPFGD
jgi:nitrogen fixation protein NifU and related proteins